MDSPEADPGETLAATAGALAEILQRLLTHQRSADTAVAPAGHAAALRRMSRALLFLVGNVHGYTERIDPQTDLEMTRALQAAHSVLGDCPDEDDIGVVEQSSPDRGADSGGWTALWDRVMQPASPRPGA